MTVTERLNKWRHLIEPETSSGLTPVAWSQVLAMPLMVMDSDNAVLVLRDCNLGERKARSIWVAAGQLDEVLSLVSEAERRARSDGLSAMVFMGRRGWIRAADGYLEMATVGLKEF